MKQKLNSLVDWAKTSLANSRTRAIVFVSLFAVIGVAAILLIHAASPHSSFEPEDGTRNGVSVCNDASASGGKCVQFGSAPTATSDCASPGPYQGYDLPSTSAYSKAAPAGHHVWFVTPVDSLSSCNPSNGTGTETSPFNSIAHAITAASSGDLIILRGGVYREAIGTLSKNLIFQSYPGEKAWIDGATVQNSGWSQSGNVWSKSWDPAGLCRGDICQDHNDQGYPGHADTECDRYFNDGRIIKLNITQNPPTTTCSGQSGSLTNVVRDPGSPAASFVDQLFYNGEPMKQIVCDSTHLPSALTLKQFCINYTTKVMYAYLANQDKPNNSRLLEASTQAVAINAGSTTGTVLRGIGVRHFASSSSSGRSDGSVVTFGNNMTVQDSIIGWSAGSAVAVSGKSNDVLKNTQVVQNGFSGVHGFKSINLVVQGGRYSYNNLENFAKDGPASSASAFNITAANGFVVEDVESDHNNAHGIWASIGTEGAIFVRNYTHDNARAGLYLERSNNGVIADNLVIHNNTDPAGHGANGGIKISSSSNIVVANNTLVDNYNDVLFTSDGRDVLHLGGADVASNHQQPCRWINSNTLLNNLSVQSGGTSGLPNYFIVASTRNSVTQSPKACSPPPAGNNVAGSTTLPSPVTPTIASFFKSNGVSHNGYWRSGLTCSYANFYSDNADAVPSNNDTCFASGHSYPLDTAANKYRLKDGGFNTGSGLSTSLVDAICNGNTAHPHDCISNATGQALGAFTGTLRF